MDPFLNYGDLNSTDPSITPGEMGTTLFHRRYASLSLAQNVLVRPYDPLRELPNPYAGVLTLQVRII